MGLTINDVVYFNINDYSLKNLVTNDSITLPVSAGCIFLILIKNRGDIVLRDTILEESWQHFGLEISNNTLNQYISLLRKNLVRLGIEDEVIKTIPKVGFCFSEEVSITDDSERKDHDLSRIPERSRTIPHLSLIIVLVLLLEVGFTVLRSSPSFAYELTQTGKIDECDLYVTKNLSAAYKKEALEIAKPLSEKYLPCRKKSIFIFDAQGGIIFQRDGRAYLSRCDINPKTGAFAGCSEVLIYEKI